MSKSQKRDTETKRTAKVGFEAYVLRTKIEPEYTQLLRRRQWEARKK